MKKSILSIVALALALLLAGCAAASSAVVSSSEEEMPQVSSAASQPQEESQTLPEDPLEMILSPLTKDEYPQLTMMAAVLERKAILPGFGVRVAVELKNEGDKTLVYTQGSGVFTTPDALMMRIDGLQPVMPKDHLGPATADFVVQELAPGESITFDMYLMTLEPSEGFDEKTQNLFIEEEKYIADLDWMTLQETYPELKAAKPGSYTGQMYFTYSIKTDTETLPLGPTGYTVAEFVIGVSE